jgi:hypothetical protein
MHSVTSVLPIVTLATDCEDHNSNQMPVLVH